MTKTDIYAIKIALEKWKPDEVAYILGIDLETILKIQKELEK